MSFLLRRTLPRLRHLVTTHASSASKLGSSCIVQNKRVCTTQTAPTAERHIIEPDVLIEEETLTGYRPKRYYPVDIGDVLHQRYKIIGKLGYGTTATVWLCRDLQEEQKFVALKIYTNSSKIQRELPIYDHINTIASKHEGRSYIRKFLDSFEIAGPHGKHTCLVHEALGMNLDDLRDLLDDRLLTPDLIRHCFRTVLTALNFLRNDAHIIHTDIQPRNILLGVTDDSPFVRFEKDEHEMPFPKKQLDSYSVYVSRPMRLTFGPPALCDFGEARVDAGHHTDYVMPDAYRAPEVLLGMPWSYPIDLWAVAMTIWDLTHPRRLFSHCD